MDSRKHLGDVNFSCAYLIWLPSKYEVLVQNWLKIFTVSQMLTSICLKTLFNFYSSSGYSDLYLKITENLPRWLEG